MAKAGRKRKAGTRTKSGALSRAGVVRYDQGTDYSRMKVSVYGTDGTDAIGRAFHHGLLGPDALNLKNAARAVFRAYWPMMGVGAEKSCLGTERGSGGHSDGIIDLDTRDRQIAREKWLTDTLRMIDRMGRDHRRAFDGLCIDINPDCGPSWMDSIIWHKTHERDVPLGDAAKLRKALEVLAIIAKSPA